MFSRLKKFYYTKILKRKYYRTGSCKGCGRCCKKIYVKNFKHVITDEKEFEQLQYLHRFYSYLKIIGRDETGLIFECTKLDPETNKCTIHKSRLWEVSCLKDVDINWNLFCLFRKFLKMLSV